MIKKTTPCMVLLVLADLVTGQNPSPCPEVFMYKPQKKEPDRWYGNISLNTREDLSGVWLWVQLDQSASLLGSWFGEVTSTNNIEFEIINKDYKLRAGVPASALFFVKYKKDSAIPSVTKILLNGKPVCGNQNINGNTPSGNSNEPDTSNRSNTNRNLDGEMSAADEENGSDSELEFFSGDLAKIRRRIRLRSSIQPSQKISSNAECGIVASRATPLITFGQDTIAGQSPWHAALFYHKDHQLRYTCGGTLITPEHILTAAHCVTKPGGNITISPVKLSIYLGIHAVNAFEPEMQSRGVSNIFIHQDYNAKVFFNDIAVLKLDKPVEITNFVRTCCLWEGENELEDIINKQGTVVGWGFNENGEVSAKLMQTQMPIVSQEKCIYSNRDFYLKFLFENNFCAGFRNGTSVCNGDSGGGMVLPRSTTSGQNTVWAIRGLVSLGVALQQEDTSTKACDTSQYAVFTDVAKYTHWIRQVLSQ